MQTWSQLPYKVWKVQQKDIGDGNNNNSNDEENSNIIEVHKDQCHADNPVTNNNSKRDQNDEISGKVCSLHNTTNIVNKAQHHQKYQCSSSCLHVQLLIIFIQKCMSAKDISSGTLQHIKVLLLKVLCGLYYENNTTDLT